MKLESIFSYVENRADGSLVLENPFLLERESGLVCVYNHTKANPSFLKPDLETTGVASWQRLLPNEAIGALPEVSVLERRPWAGVSLGDVPVEWVSFRPQLVFDIALPVALANDCPGAWLAGERWEIAMLDALLAQPAIARRWEMVPDGNGPPADATELAGSLVAAHAKRPPGFFDFGVWGNPFRAEGLKLIGLELGRRRQTVLPTLIVHDICGELLHGLFLAARHHQALAGEYPYRVILVQERPYDFLCRVFEGADPDWAPLARPDNHLCVKTPTPLLAPIGSFLADCGGTAISLETQPQGPGQLFDAALQLLLRTGFVDDEDEVYLLSARQPIN